MYLYAGRFTNKQVPSLCTILSGKAEQIMYPFTRHKVLVGLKDKRRQN